MSLKRTWPGRSPRPTATLGRQISRSQKSGHATAHHCITPTRAFRLSHYPSPLLRPTRSGSIERQLRSCRRARTRDQRASRSVSRTGLNGKYLTGRNIRGRCEAEERGERTRSMFVVYNLALRLSLRISSFHHHPVKMVHPCSRDVITEIWSRVV